MQTGLESAVGESWVGRKQAKALEVGRRMELRNGTETKSFFSPLHLSEKINIYINANVLKSKSPFMKTTCLLNYL